jgi:antitoxin (DNA-binding transcriptional repressor) of toxin-antitoxin stability system
VWFDEGGRRTAAFPFSAEVRVVSSFISIAEAQARLAEIIDEMIPGESLFLTLNDHPIAKLVRTDYLPLTEPRQPGSAVGKLFILEDDDSHLEDFKEYME